MAVLLDRLMGAVIQFQHRLVEEAAAESLPGWHRIQEAVVADQLLHQEQYQETLHLEDHPLLLVLAALVVHLLYIFPAVAVAVATATPPATQVRGVRVITVVAAAVVAQRLMPTMQARAGMAGMGFWL